MMKVNYTYWAFVDRVVDGDTMDVTIDLGLGVLKKERIRVKDYDAPESYRPKTEAEKIHGEEAKSEAVRLLFNRWVIVATYKDKKGKYGRYIADVKLTNAYGVGVGDYATIMKQSGFAKRDDYGESA